MGTKFWQLVRFFSSSAASSPYGSILGTTPFSLSQFLQPLVFLFDFKVVSKQLQECCQGCREHGLILSYLYLILKLCQNNCKSIIKYQIWSRLPESMDWTRPGLTVATRSCSWNALRFRDFYTSRCFKHFLQLEILRFKTLTFIPLDFEPLRLRLGDFHTSTPLYLLL